MPHITVTIPVFNRAHLVGRTIESVLRQDFEDYDLLIVDDASSDGTVEVIKQYAQRDSRIKLVINEKNLGLTRNWNKCLELARGPLVQLLLSDDLIDADYLSKVSSVFDTYPDVGMVAASCRYIDATDRIIGEGKAIEGKLYKAGDDAILNFLTQGYPHVSSIVFKRECYEKLGPFNEKIWHGPDVEMDTRIAQEYDFYHLGGVYTAFRRHGTNMGALEYLREDFLEADCLKFRISWSRLSRGALQKLGIYNLESYLASIAAKSALTGIPIAIAYNRSDRGWFYWQKAFQFQKRTLLSLGLWKYFLMLLLPGYFSRLMQRRMNIDQVDCDRAEIIRRSLENIQ